MSKAKETTETKTKRERKPPKPLDMFSAAKKISDTLGAFSLDEQLTTLRFVQGVLETKLKAQQAAAFAAQRPAYASDVTRVGGIVPPSDDADVAKERICQ